MALKDNILTKKKFSKLIEETIAKTKLSYLDAVIYVCELKGLDTKDVSSLLSPIIKDKIEAEAVSYNMIKGGNKLPI